MIFWLSRENASEKAYSPRRGKLRSLVLLDTSHTQRSRSPLIASRFPSRENSARFERSVVGLANQFVWLLSVCEKTTFPSCATNATSFPPAASAAHAN